MKHNGDIKSRGYANSSYQRVHADKNRVSSPTPDFYAVKYICSVDEKRKET